MKKGLTRLKLGVMALVMCFGLAGEPVFAKGTSNATVTGNISEIQNVVTMTHAEVEEVMEKVSGFNDQEILELIDAMPKNYVSEFTLSVEDVLNTNKMARAGSYQSGTYEQEIETGTPGVYLNISVDYELTRENGIAKFTSAQGYISVKKKFWETLWATSIITSTSNRYHQITDNGKKIKISTDVHFNVYTQAIPSGLEYDEHHEMVVSSEDV